MRFHTLGVTLTLAGIIATVAGCSTSPLPSTSVSSLDWSPTYAGGAALGSGKLYTSPDGGIYVNPDRLTVSAVVTGKAGNLGGIVGVSNFSKLATFGPYTYVVMTVTNLGQGVSTPQFNDTQLAVELAPPAALHGPTSSLYSPIFPIGLLSSVPIQSSCAINLNPGQKVWVVLMYPPIQSSAKFPSVVWGEYQDFQLTLARYNHAASLPDTLYAGSCPTAFPNQTVPATPSSSTSSTTTPSQDATPSIPPTTTPIRAASSHTTNPG